MFQMRALLLVSMIALLVTVLTWLGRATTRNTEVVLPAATTRGCPTLRIGLIPERDIFQQRQAYRALGDYLQQKLSVRVEQSTSYSYQGVLQDYHDAKIDVAFLGSLVAMLAVDRFDAQVVLKSETVDGSSSFAGVVFVPEGSPIKSLAELRGHTLGAVRTTTAGPLFVVYLMTLLNMTGKHESPRFVWSGTHDDVIEEVMAGRIDAGASKDLRLDAYLRQHPGVAVRRLATSAQLPDSALVIRRDVDGRLVARLTETLIAMDGDPNGRRVLAQMGVAGFVPCSIGEYEPLYAMIDTIGPRWRESGVDGLPPRRRGSAPTPAPATNGNVGKMGD